MCGHRGAEEGSVFSGCLLGTGVLFCSVSFRDIPASQATINLFKEPGLVSSRVRNEPARATVAVPRLSQRLWTFARVTLGNFPFCSVKGLRGRDNGWVILEPLPRVQAVELVPAASGGSESQAAAAPTARPG